MSWWQKLAGKVRSVFGGPGAKSGGCDHSEIQLRQGTAEFEEFIVRAELETTKNLKHAAGHLGNLLSYDPGRPEWIELLETFLKEAGPDAEALIPRDDKLYFTTEALRAYLWHKQSRLVQALDLLAQVTQAKPEARYLEAWALGWLEPAGAVESLPSEVALPLFAVALNRFPEASRSPVSRLREVGRYAGLMDRWVAANSSPGNANDGMTTMLRAGLHRKAANFAQALAIVRPALERSPDWHSATALGLILRYQGDAPAAEQAFRQALALDPEDVSAYLEAADMFLERGDWQAALGWYEGARAKERQQPWALPSALYCRWKLTGAEQHLQALIKLAQRTPANDRAIQLAQAAYGGGLPEPSDASANLLRQFRQMVLDDRANAPTGEAKMTITSLEAPSNYLAFRLEMAALQHDLHLKVLVNQIPKPDPRAPIAPVDWVLWRYEGSDATPGLPPPGRDVVERIAAIAQPPFDFEACWAGASRAAAELGPGRVAEILATMVHPPPLPAGQPALSWLPRVHLAAAATIAQMDSGWADSVRRRGLIAVLHGPMDWATDAAIRALAHVGRTEEAHAPDIHEAFQLLADHRPSHGYWSWERTLWDHWRTLPHLFPEERAKMQKELQRIDEAAQQE